MKILNSQPCSLRGLAAHNLAADVRIRVKMYLKGLFKVKCTLNCPRGAVYNQSGSASENFAKLCGQQ